MRIAIIVILAAAVCVLWGLSLHYQSAAKSWESKAWKQMELTERAIKISEDCSDSLQECVDMQKE